MNNNNTDPIKTVGVIGAGVIGASWSALFIANDLSVIAHDPDPTTEETMRALVGVALGDLEQLGMRGSGSLTFAPSLEEAMSSVDFIQENAPERLDLKVDLFAKIDAVTPSNIIVASSTSSLLRSKMITRCANPDRFIVGHPFNPPHLIPLVEIIGPAPDAETTLRADAFYRSIGKETVIMKKEAVGHLVNRLNSALWREAVSLFQQGLADPADIDRAIKAGPALRWPILGPYETYHLGGGEGGIAHYFEHLQPIQEERWENMPTPKMDDAFRKEIVAHVQRSAAGKSIKELAKLRDERLLEVLKIRDKLTD